MWSLKNSTPYAAERNWTRDRAGAHWWLVAVRATFDFDASGRLRLADEQLAPLLAPEYFGEPGTSSLECDADLLAVKPGTDLLLNAHAYAPRGAATQTVPVGFRLDSLEKQLLVHGERTYEKRLRGLKLTPPQPFITQELRYECAYGGTDLSDPNPAEHRMDERNPVGRGVARRSDTLLGSKAHCIEYPGLAPAKAGPAGFGAIDAAWLPRRALAGTYDAEWEKKKKPLLPEDYDPAFTLSAPVDQRTPRPLVGGERLALSNLTREGHAEFELPKLSFALVSRFGRRERPHGALLTRVLVEPTEQRLSLVWQSALRVAAPDADYLDETQISEQTPS